MAGSCYKYQFYGNHLVSKLRRVETPESLCCLLLPGDPSQLLHIPTSPWLLCPLFPTPLPWGSVTATSTAKGMLLPQSSGKLAHTGLRTQRDEVQSQVKQAAVSISSQLSGFKEHLEQRPWIPLSQGS